MKPMPAMTPADQDRFWQSVQCGRSDSCWEWQGYVLASGYGQFKLNYRNYRAHRVTYWLATKHDPGRQLVCHTCDNRRCCNPTHLFTGEPIDNSTDMKVKGRAARLQGIHHGRAKLTDRDVKLIRVSRMGPTAIAQHFGVCPSLICQIRNYTIWKHLT